MRVRRQRRTVFAFAGFFALFSLVLLVVGIHDASLDLAGFGLTIGSMLLIAIGATFAFAAWDLVRLARRPWPRGKRPPCRLVVLAAFLFAFLLGVYVALLGLETESSQRPYVALVGALMAAASVGGFVFFHGEHVSKPKIGAALGITILGIAIGAWEFWYQNQYVPSRAGRSVELSVKLHEDSHQQAYDVIRATIDYEELGGKSAFVVGSAYTLTGSRLDVCARPATLKRVQSYFDYSLVDPQRTRYTDYVQEKPPTLLAAGKFVGDGKHLDTGVPFARDLVFFVPHGYQLLRLRAQLFAIPDSVPISQRSPPIYRVYPHDHELYAFWHVDDNSWFRDLVTGRQRWVIVRYELVDPAHPSSSAVTTAMRVQARFPASTWSDTAPSERTAAALFALRPEQTPGGVTKEGTSPPLDSSDPFADTELALAPLPKATC